MFIKTICSNMGGFGGHYAKYSKSERDKYCMISFIREIVKQKQTHSYREKIDWRL